MHEKIAEGLLTVIHVRTGLDVGEMPNESVAGTVEDDPQRLVRIVSHMVARAFDKLPPLRRISRQAEGADKRSGFLSDALAAAGEIYRRNPDKVKQLGAEYYNAFQVKRAAALAEKQAASNGKVTTPMEGNVNAPG